MKNFHENIEKYLTAIFSALGAIAIIINLHFKGYSNENLLDAVKDLSGLIVVIAVFLIASKIFSINKNKKYNFNEKFEEYLVEWAGQNKSLIDVTEISKPTGKENVRTIDMICDHELMLTCVDVSLSSGKKGSFLYLPASEDLGDQKKVDSNKLSFKINKSMFRKNSAVFDQYEEKKSEITQKIAASIMQKFSGIPGFNIYAEGRDDRIVVNFSGIDHTDENARKLIQVVEFVKTLFLAIA
jgi:hypothetical protein